MIVHGNKKAIRHVKNLDHATLTFIFISSQNDELLSFYYLLHSEFCLNQSYRVKISKKTFISSSQNDTISDKMIA